MPGAPPCPFGADWNALTLAAVKAFFAASPPERSPWVAGPRAPRASSGAPWGKGVEDEDIAEGAGDDCLRVEVGLPAQLGVLARPRELA